MPVLVSACLIGVCCRYDGASKPDSRVLALMSGHTLIPVCPEILGGLPTPRIPSEIRGDRVINREGRDVTAAYERGAEECLKLAHFYGCRCAILKERSPACGCGTRYDGTFSGTLVQGDGIAAARLKEAGIKVIGESDLPDYFDSR